MDKPQKVMLMDGTTPFANAGRGESKSTLSRSSNFSLLHTVNHINSESQSRTGTQTANPFFTFNTNERVRTHANAEKWHFADDKTHTNGRNDSNKLIAIERIKI
jgi:hypothetical protein